MSHGQSSARARIRLARALALGLLSTLLAAPAAVASPRPPQAPTFTELLRGASLVVQGEVVELADDPEGRFRSAQLRVEKVLKDDLERKASDLGLLHVVEERRFVSIPPILRGKGAALGFLAKAPASSARDKALEAREYQRPVKGRWGWISFSSAAEAREIGAAVEGWLALGKRKDRDSAEWTKEYRALVFREVGSRRIRLVEDGIQGLDALRDLAETLTSSEQRTLERCLRRSDLPRHARLALIDVVVREQIRSLAEALKDLPGRDSEVSTAAWKAQRALGVELSPEQLGEALRDSDPGIRAAASEEVVASRAEEAFEEVERLAREDPERLVRLAAIRSLGRARRPAALEVLQETFADPDPKVRSTTAEAIFEIGETHSRDAAVALAKLVFTAPEEAQRQAVVIMLAMGVPKDDPLLSEIRENHPDPLVREMATHGIRSHHDE